MSIKIWQLGKLTLFYYAFTIMSRKKVAPFLLVILVYDINVSELSSFVTDLSNLFSQCKKLQVLNLKGCVLMDNTAVGVLAKHCSYLLSLSLSGCHMVSDRGVMMLSEKCQYLQALDLTRTKVSN